MRFERKLKRRQQYIAEKQLIKTLKSNTDLMTKDNHCFSCGKEFIFNKSDIKDWYVTVYEENVVYCCKECKKEKSKE